MPGAVGCWCEALRDSDARQGLNEVCIDQTQTAKAQACRTRNTNLMLRQLSLRCEAWCISVRHGLTRTRSTADSARDARRGLTEACVNQTRTAKSQAYKTRNMKAHVGWLYRDCCQFGMRGAAWLGREAPCYSDAWCSLIWMLGAMWLGCNARPDYSIIAKILDI